LMPSSFHFLLIFLVCALVHGTSAQSCNADGLSGSCVDVNTQKCSGILLQGFCAGPDNVQCCVTDLPACNTPSGSGTCTLTSSCSGTSVPGYCPGPDTVECCVAGGGGWSRTDALNVAAAWVKAGVLYSWSETTLQWVSSGQGPYRSDCSGFVSACWNEPPPGYVTQSFPCYQIDASDLQPGDALLDPAEHVALFIGWHASGQPIVIEECGHVPACCGSQATCPGACGSYTDCNEYCPGCPIQVHTWPEIYSGFYPCRRNGW